MRKSKADPWRLNVLLMDDLTTDAGSKVAFGKDCDQPAPW